MQEMLKTKQKVQKYKGVFVVSFRCLPQIYKCRYLHVDIFMGLMAFDEGLNEVTQALDEVVAHLLPANPNQVPIQQDSLP